MSKIGGRWPQVIVVLSLGAGAAFGANTPCTYTLSYSSLSVQPGGGTQSVDLATGTSCGWSASTDVSWISILAGTSGTGPGTITFSVIATNSTASRTGHLTLQGQSLAITQVALLGPQAQIQQILMSRIQVTTPPLLNSSTCPTTPGPTTTFLPTDFAAYVFVFFTNVNPGDTFQSEYHAPDGSVYANAGSSYTVPADTRSVCWQDQGMKIVGAPPAVMPGLWTAFVKVNGTLVITSAFSIAQTSGCSYILSPTSISVPPIAASGYSVAVSTSTNCAWNVVNNSSWVFVTADSSGIGPGSVTFAVSANGGDSRTAILTIGSQAVAITQVANGGPIAQIDQVWMTHIQFVNTLTKCSDASAPAAAYTPTDAAAYLFLTINQLKAGDVLSDQYIAPNGSVYANAGGSFTQPVNNPASCWGDPGISIRGTPAANLTGNWTVKVYVNNVLMITTAFSIVGGSNCSYSINPASANVPAGGGTGTVGVTADPGCSWTASTTASWVHITSGSSGTGGGSVGYSADANTGDTRTGTISIGGQSFTLTEASGLPTLPAITQGGIADPWTYTKGVAPGAWVSIFGSNLANSTQTWSPTPGQPLATTLAGVSVTVDGVAAPPSYVSPTLVNVLIPAAVRTGPVQVVVTNNGLASLPTTVQSTQFLPAIYSNAAPGSSPPRFYVTAVDPLTNQLLGNLSADPRVVRAPRAGDTIDLYGLGLGSSSPRFPTDVAFSAAYNVNTVPSVNVGGVSVTPSFAALVAPGLYQMRITLPASLPPGDQSIQLDFGGGVQSAQNVFLSLQR